MKISKIVVFTLLFLLFTVACNNSADKRDVQVATGSAGNVTDSTIVVYYFHGSVRCPTCVAVEVSTGEFLKELFPKKMKKGEIIYKVFNIDKGEAPQLVNKYQIYGQTVLFVKNDKVIDETDNAFKYVSSNETKWKNIIKKSINELLN